MKILKFQAENIKKLSVVEITPDGNIVQITGKNASGKTSVLDSLWWLFTGTSNIQAQPIRHGQETARIEAHLGDKTVEVIAERTFTPTNSYLTIKTADGAKYPKPQAFMDDLLGSLTMDPFAFMRKKPAEQFDAVRGLVKLDIDPEALDAANIVDFDTRTDINRQAKQKRTQAAAITVPHDAPAEGVDETALLDKISAAAEANADIERRKANRINAAKRIEADREQILATRREIERLTALADLNAAECDRLEKEVADAGPLPDPVDISAVRAELEAAKAINAGVTARTARAAVEAEAAELEAQADELTALMGECTAKKLAAIAAAKMPLKGLSLGDGIVTFNGVPLDQASDAEQLTVSLSIATALNPKLRVLRIRDGSLLDEDAMKRLGKFADEQNMQVWIEVVGSGGVGFEMVDGHLKGRDLPAPEAVKPAAKKKAAA